MIPKTIHYCWFGGKPLPKSARKCVASWRKFFPGYEIREWSEKNFDVDAIPYTRDAYAAGKYAFVSDYARFWVLYHYGGLYFDTDVEVIRPMDDIVAQGAFMGWESREGGKNASVNPGLGLGAAAAMPLYAEILARFAEMSFWGAGGVRSPYSMIPMVTELLHGKGLALTGETQTLDGALTVYSAEYFNPKDSLTGKIVLTGNTRTIHHYTMSWVSWHRRLGTKIMRLVHYASKRCH